MVSLQHVRHISSLFLQVKVVLNMDSNSSIISSVSSNVVYFHSRFCSNLSLITLIGVLVNNATREMPRIAMKAAVKFKFSSCQELEDLVPASSSSGDGLWQTEASTESKNWLVVFWWIFNTKHLPTKWLCLLTSLRDSIEKLFTPAIRISMTFKNLQDLRPDSRTFQAWKMSLLNSRTFEDLYEPWWKFVEERLKTTVTGFDRPMSLSRQCQSVVTQPTVSDVTQPMVSVRCHSVNSVSQMTLS